MMVVEEALLLEVERKFLSDGFRVKETLWPPRKR